MFFNDRRSATPDVAYNTEAAPDPREPQIGRGNSVFAWLHRGPEPTESLAVTLDDASKAVSTDNADSTDSGDKTALSLSLHFDTHLIAPGLIERIAWDVENAAAQAERDGTARTGV